MNTKTFENCTVIEVSRHEVEELIRRETGQVFDINYCVGEDVVTVNLYDLDSLGLKERWFGFYYDFCKGMYDNNRIAYGNEKVLFSIMYALMNESRGIQLGYYVIR